MHRHPSARQRLVAPADAPDAATTPAPPTGAGVPDADGGWTANDPTTRAFLDALRDAACSGAPVYLYGERGSGLRCATRLLRHWRDEWKATGRPGADGCAPVRTLQVPSLQERPLDLPGIAARWLEQLAQADGHPVRTLTPRALGALQAREWRENITELHAVLTVAAQRAGDRALVDAGDLPRGSPPPRHPSQIAKDTAQRDCLLCQLRVARSISAAARLEGCSRANYIRLMRRLGIRLADGTGRQSR